PAPFRLPVRAGGEFISRCPSAGEPAGKIVGAPRLTSNHGGNVAGSDARRRGHPMMPCLEVVGPGERAGTIVPLSSSPLTIGRGPQCQLCSTSPLVSRRHCALFCQNGKVEVQDLDSRNG